MSTPTLAVRTDAARQPGAVDVDVAELVDLIARIGGGVRVEEIAYQLRRRGRPASPSAIMEALCEAESRGLLTPWAWTIGPEAGG